MKSYEETIRKTAAFDFRLRCELPTEYMHFVFGVTSKQDPELYNCLLRAGHSGGIHRLLETLSHEYTQKLIKYLSR